MIQSHFMQPLPASQAGDGRQGPTPHSPAIERFTEEETNDLASSHPAWHALRNLEIQKQLRMLTELGDTGWHGPLLEQQGQAQEETGIGGH